MDNQIKMVGHGKDKRTEGIEGRTSELQHTATIFLCLTMNPYNKYLFRMYSKTNSVHSLRGVSSYRPCFFWFCELNV